jgi:signal transduction histidine kinase
MVMLLAAGAGARAVGSDDAAPITTAAAVRSLSAPNASRSLPVRLEGIVITVARLGFVLMDETDGVYVRTPETLVRPVQPGEWIEVEGNTHPGAFAPVVTAAVVRVHGMRPLPAPMRTTVSEIATGGFDAKWVVVEGIVRNCTTSLETQNSAAGPLPAPTDRTEPREITTLTLAWGDAQLQVKVQEALNAANLVDARIEIRGVCFNVHNANRQFVRASLAAFGRSLITVVAAPPADPFALPLQSAGELLQFNPAGFSGHRVHLQGVVTHRLPGKALWIRDGNRGLRVVSTQTEQTIPGDQIDIAGFVDWGKYSPSLGDAIFRRTSGGIPPAPVQIEHFTEIVGHEADLIQIEADLKGIHQESDGTLLTLAWDNTQLQGVLPWESGGSLPDDWQPGSRIRVSGICALAPGTLMPTSGLWKAEGFRLLLRDKADVSVLRPAPWLTQRRASQLLGWGAVFFVVLLIVIWVASRRQIARREVDRKMAEREFTAILGERNRMARDIHDTLAQGLNAISMQLELAKNAATKGTDAMLANVVTTHAIVRGCIAEARESIWNMRSHVLEKTDLPGALEGVLRQMSAGLPLEVEVEVAGEKHRLSPQWENDLLRIGQEAISNAIKHSGASRLMLRFEFEPDRVRMRISDNGTGFDLAASRRASRRFGLTGMRERVEQMHATLRIISAPHQGTEVIVEVLSSNGGVSRALPA